MKICVGKELTNSLRPFTQAQNSGFPANSFVLNKRIVIAQLISLMVMKQYQGCGNLTYNSPAKLRKFRKRNIVMKTNGQ